MIHNIVKGFGVKMHRVDNAANLKKLLSSAELTHLFVSEEEYEAASDMIEAVASKVVAVVVANKDFKLRPGSKARIMEKPFYCFPVASILNADHDVHETESALFYTGIEALVVDDEPMNLIVAQNILRRYGISAVTAGSGIEAVDMCKKRSFDIIFMDHMMPGMDGIETMKRIRAGSSGSSTPIVALTANAVSTAREMFMSEGFDGFVSKPIELTEMERILRRLLPKSSETSADITLNKAPEEAPLPAEEKNEPTIMEKLSECGLNTEEALRYCGNDEDFYQKLIVQFIDEEAEKVESMAGFLRENDIKNYEIVVHSLKNTMKLIGCSDLSERAKELEFAAKDNNTGLIGEKHPLLMADYHSLTEKLRGIFGISPADAGFEFITDDDDEDDDDIMEFAPDTGNEG
jgi:CheY-like chemotaxis protein/HPt (histidine-containing phosphotransfer) domain-containing protein